MRGQHWLGKGSYACRPSQDNMTIVYLYNILQTCPGMHHAGSLWADQRFNV